MITPERAEFLNGINGYYVTLTRLGLFITPNTGRIPIPPFFV